MPFHFMKILRVITLKLQFAHKHTWLLNDTVHSVSLAYSMAIHSNPSWAISPVGEANHHLLWLNLFKERASPEWDS